ncbi:uncharacterized protein DS421_15g491480 [Arachis hypogaea]|nr:uncharacterized protein DS421_15g491480 [Arachis hypogaea]QHO10652.1 uncharacterized protein DS421_15g491480 [Arachis hypogaea]
MTPYLTQNLKFAGSFSIVMVQPNSIHNISLEIGHLYIPLLMYAYFRSFLSCQLLHTFEFLLFFPFFSYFYIYI